MLGKTLHCPVVKVSEELAKAIGSLAIPAPEQEKEVKILQQFIWNTWTLTPGLTIRIDSKIANRWIKEKKAEPV
jgi:hypothetical protein